MVILAFIARIMPLWFCSLSQNSVCKVAPILRGSSCWSLLTNDDLQYLEIWQHCQMPQFDHKPYDVGIFLKSPAAGVRWLMTVLACIKKNKEIKCLTLVVMEENLKLWILQNSYYFENKCSVDPSHDFVEPDTWFLDMSVWEPCPIWVHS